MKRTAARGRGIDASTLRMVLLVLTGWFDRREGQALAYLMEENRVLRRRLGQHRLQLPTPIGDGLWSGDIGWDGRCCVRSPPS